MSLTRYTSHALSNSDLHNAKCDAYHLMGCTVLIVLLLCNSIPTTIDNILRKFAADTGYINISD